MDNSKQATGQVGAKPLTKAQRRLLDRLALCKPGTGEVIYRMDKATANRLAVDGLCEVRDGGLVTVAIITETGRAELARHEATPDVPTTRSDAVREYEAAFSGRGWFEDGVLCAQANKSIDTGLAELAQYGFTPNNTGRDEFIAGWRSVTNVAAATPGNGTGATDGKMLCKCTRCDQETWKALDERWQCPNCGAFYEFPANSASAPAEPQPSDVAAALKPLGIVDGRLACPKCGQRDTSLFLPKHYLYQCDNCDYVFSAPDDPTSALTAAEAATVAEIRDRANALRLPIRASQWAMRAALDRDNLLAIITRLTTPPQPDALPDGVSVEREEFHKTGVAISVLFLQQGIEEAVVVTRDIPEDTPIISMPRKVWLHTVDEVRLLHAALGVALREAAKLEREAK